MTDSERAAIRAQAFKEAAEIARWHQIELRPGVRVIDADALVAAIEAAAKGGQK